ncbi:MAG: hypothetical protein KC766_19940 [Myxococcales bacterium]|nr:hypothetical protein [Myxococcales bacterium]
MKHWRNQDTELDEAYAEMQLEPFDSRSRGETPAYVAAMLTMLAIRLWPLWLIIGAAYFVARN